MPTRARRKRLRRRYHRTDGYGQAASLTLFCWPHAQGNNSSSFAIHSQVGEDYPGRGQGSPPPTSAIPLIIDLSGRLRPRGQGALVLDPLSIACQWLVVNFVRVDYGGLT